MVDVNRIINIIIKGLNSICHDFIFIKANQKGKLLKYPYGTIKVLSAYIQDKDSFEAEVFYKETNEGLKMFRKEEPQMIIDLTFCGEDYNQVYKYIKVVQDWLLLQGKQYLSEYDIILLERTTTVDKGSVVLETEYHYRYGFDIRVRVLDIISMLVDEISGVEIKNKNSGDKIEKGGNL